MFPAYSIMTGKVGFVVFVPVSLRPTAVELTKAQRQSTGHKFRFISEDEIDWIASAYPRVKSIWDAESRIDTPSTYIGAMREKWEAMLLECAATGRNSPPTYFNKGVKHLNLTWYQITSEEMLARRLTDFDRAIELQQKAFEDVDRSGDTSTSRNLRSGKGKLIIHYPDSLLTKP